MRQIAYILVAALALAACVAAPPPVVEAPKLSAAAEFCKEISGQFSIDEDVEEVGLPPLWRSANEKEAKNFLRATGGGDIPGFAHTQTVAVWVTPNLASVGVGLVGVYAEPCRIAGATLTLNTIEKGLPPGPGLQALKKHLTGGSI